MTPSPVGPGGRRHLRTRCVHRPARPDATRPGLSLPIDRSSTFLQDDAARDLTDAGRWDEALVYARYGSPTVEAVEHHLADLEGAQRGVLFSSGMAAIHAALLGLRQPGRPVAVARELYGGTADLLTALAELGVEALPFSVTDPASLSSALDQGAGLVWLETVSNPTLRVADLPAVVGRARTAGARVVVDSTFTSPALCRPLAHGVDAVVHSATKLLGGHSDLLAGVVLGDAELLDPVWTWRKRAGGSLDPQAAWLLERGLATLALRAEAAGRGAVAVAEALAQDPRVAWVSHPSLPSHPDHALAADLLEGPVPLVAFALCEGDAGLRPFADRLRVALDAPSLGGVETLVSLPAFMSHAALSPAEREAVGIGPGTVRVAVGIEDPRDLVEDLLQALG
jgi:cystathionine beta-lyase/cystathionine gamma-synthase